MLQPRFERRASHSAMALLEQPRFRAGLDFLRLRGEVGEADPELAVWWEALYQAGDEKRRDLLDSVRETRGPRRVKREATRAPATGRADGDAPRANEAGQRDAAANDAPEASESGDAAEAASAGLDAAAPRKRRRRRRRPADSAGTPS